MFAPPDSDSTTFVLDTFVGVHPAPPATEDVVDPNKEATLGLASAEDESTTRARMFQTNLRAHGWSDVSDEFMGVLEPSNAGSCGSKHKKNPDEKDSATLPLLLNDNGGRRTTS